MATTTIPWGDGSGDNIYLTYSASTGDQTVLVSSDANGGAARQKVITFVSTVGNISRSLTVLQESGMDYVSITWNDVCITYNDTAIAYPYEEPYIVFVDPIVEQICATNWGDGTGIKPSQAAQVTNSQFGTTFNGRTDVTSFEEFAYFTGVTTIANSAFNGCSLERLVLPSSVTTINRAFQNTQLQYLDLPDGVTFSLNNTFTGTTTLQEVTFRGTYNPSLYLFQPCTLLKRANIASVDVWASNSFSQVGTIGQYSGELHLYLIGSNTEITSLSISGSVGTVGSWTFYNCIGLASVTIGEGVTSIGDSAFRGCTGLSIVDIPSTVSSIATYVFNKVGTTANKCTFIVRATTPPSLANANAFTADRINKIYVPSGTLSAYQAATNWSSFASYMAELDTNGNIPT